MYSFLIDRILDLLKFQNFVNDRSHVSKIVVLVSERLENIVSKGENTGYQHFSFTHNDFKGFSLKTIKKVKTSPVKAGNV